MVDEYIKFERECEHKIILSQQDVNELFTELDGLHDKIDFKEHNYPILYQIWNYLTKQD